jgi:hypothetical protein
MTKVTVAAPFNSIGYQMNPTPQLCEQKLKSLAGCEVIAINPLASGYLSPDEAAAYTGQLDGLTGICAGISRDEHAKETFKIFRRAMVGS